MHVFKPPPKSRYLAKPAPDLVLFLTGFKFTRRWNLWKKWQINKAIAAILQELENSPDCGYLGYQRWSGNPNLIIQYWRDHESLIQYARNKDAAHFPYWVAFNTFIADDATIGIWHETYQVHGGDSEGLYRNMKPLGLGRVIGAEKLYGDATEV